MTSHQQTVAVDQGLDIGLHVLDGRDRAAGARAARVQYRQLLDLLGEPALGGRMTLANARAGEPPLFPAPEKRDGYLRADPRDPAVARWWPPMRASPAPRLSARSTGWGWPGWCWPSP